MCVHSYGLTKVIAVGRDKGKSLAQPPAHTSVRNEFRLRPQDHQHPVVS